MCTKIDKESTFGPHFLREILIFDEFVGSLWVPGGLRRRPRSVPEAFNFFINFRLDLKTSHDWTPGGPRDPAGASQAPPANHLPWILVVLMHLHNAGVQSTVQINIQSTFGKPLRPHQHE